MTTTAPPERPIVGVGAVILEENRVLLIRRGHEPLKGEWSLPGGRVELGETLVAALCREVREETGLTVEVGAVIEVLDRVHRDASGRVEHHFVIIDYLCRLVDGSLAASSDADDARWVRLDDLNEYRLTEAAARVIERGRRIAAIRGAATRNTQARRGAR